MGREKYGLVIVGNAIEQVQLHVGNKKSKELRTSMSHFSHGSHNEGRVRKPKGIEFEIQKKQPKVDISFVIMHSELQKIVKRIKPFDKGCLSFPICLGYLALI